LRQKRPFWAEFWRAVRPPQRTRPRRPFTRRQTLLLRASAAAVLAGILAWFSAGYFSTAEARSFEVLRQGLDRLGPGDYPGAVDRFTAALEIWPENAQAYLERGNAYYAMGRSADALADWTRALEADPDLAAAYAARGAYYRARGDTASALADLSRSIELKPSVEAYYERGQVYQALGQYRQAAADLDRAIAELPSAPYVYRARSAARRAMGDMAGAGADRDQADYLEQLH
jgi:tetratricopeptide (TPR) repeat protein